MILIITFTCSIILAEDGHDGSTPTPSDHNAMHEDHEHHHEEDETDDEEFGDVLTPEDNKEALKKWKEKYT